jgi:4-amino-4-deoxy-L-arabinose transferase-like glycosyltransferase
MSQTVDGLTIGDARLSLRSCGWLLLYGSSLLLVDLGRGWVLTYHEHIFASGAREFLQEGRWLIPRYLGSQLFEYPPLTQWLIALSMTVFRSDAEWVARFPIVLSALANAWLIAWTSARWHGDRVGRITGLIQLTTFYGLMQSRLAESDMILTMMVTAAMVSMASGVIDRPIGSRSPRWLSIGYFAATALSFLAKGPIGPAFIALGSLAYALLDRRRAVWKFLLNPVGWGLLLFVAIGWLSASTLNDPRTFEMMRDNLVNRFAKGTAMHTDGREGPFFYLYMVPLLLLPWTPWAVVGLVRGSSGGERPRAFWTFLACWFGAGLIFLSCSAFKHKHYVIPLLTPLSVYAACGLDRHASLRERGRLFPALVAVGTLLGVLAFVSLARSSPGPENVSLWFALTVAIGGAGTILSLWFRRSGQTDRSLSAVFGSVWLIVLVVRSAVLPSFDDYLDESRMAHRLNERVAPGTPIYMVATKYAEMSYYLRPPLVRQDQVSLFADVLNWRKPGEPVYAVAYEDVFADLRKLGDVRILEQSPRRKRIAVLEIRRAAPVVGDQADRGYNRDAVEPLTPPATRR